MNFRQASNHCKRVLKTVKLAHANKTKSITFNSVLNKGKSAIPSLLNGLEMLFFASKKAKLFPKNFFFLTSHLDDSGISLPVYPSRTNLKLHNISATLQLVKMVINNLDFSKASNPDCFLVVVL